MTSFEKFGNHFQLRLFYYLIDDKDFAAQVLEILQPDFFVNEHFKTLALMLLGYFEKYNGMPSFDTIQTMLSTEIDDQVEREYLLDVLSKIKSDTDDADREFIEDKAVEFCKQQAMVRAVQDCVPLIKNEQYDQIFDIMQKAINAGTTRDEGLDYFETALIRTMATRSAVATGFPLLDRHLAGGLGAGETGIILAGTGVGKSMMLVFLAAEALKQGLNVLYYTFELSHELVALRLDSKLTGIPLSTLLLDSEGQYRQRVHNRLESIRQSTGKRPKLFIKEYPTKTASIVTLRNNIMRLRQTRGFVPDIILVDYADIMKPAAAYKEKRYELEGNIEQLRGLAGELKVPVWTASQTNRDGLEASVVGLQTISESLAKAMVADAIISIGRDHALVERGEACYYLAKNRFGSDKLIFTGRYDTSTLDFTIDREGLDEGELRNDATRARNTQINERVKELFGTRGE